MGIDLEGMPADGAGTPAKSPTLVRDVEVSNFRSIVNLSVELGRINVVIGANGSGKSNLLEAIAVAGAGAAHRGNNEFLASRGVRPVIPELTSPRFPGLPQTAAPSIKVDGASFIIGRDAVKSDLTFSSGLSNIRVTAEEIATVATLGDGNGFLERDAVALLAKIVFRSASPERALELAEALESAIRGANFPTLASFLIFSPDYYALRNFSDEGQILPLGVRGEGLFKHLIDLTKRHPDIVARISEHLRVLDWFDGFVIPTDLGPGEKRLAIRDRYLEAEVSLDQRSANEGFLFLLFAYTALLSPETPRFFAIDNADTSLNPRVCARMMSDIVTLAKEADKQVIVTTHNAALLDGLDLTDDAQRLFVCERDLDGYTALRRVTAPKGTTRLSEAFLRGYLGGLPRSF